MTQIPLDANSFEANGHKYLIHPSLSVARFEIFEQQQIWVEYGSSASAFRQEAVQVYELLNKGKFADASVAQRNLIDGVARVAEKRAHPVLLMCTLFVVREGEDTAQWSETDAAEKIADWRKAGIESAFFFHLLKRLGAAYMQGLEQGTPNTLAVEK